MRLISRIRGFFGALQGFKLELSVSDTLLRLETPERVDVTFTFRDRGIPEALINLYANEGLAFQRRTDLEGRLSDQFNFKQPGIYNLQARFEELMLVVESNVVTVRAGLFRLNIGTGEGGTTNPAAGTYEYNQDTEAKVQAVPNSGWGLDHWTLDDAEAGTANPIPLKMDWDHKLQPLFKKIEWTDKWGHVVGETWMIPGGSYYTLKRSVNGSPFPDSQPYYLWSTSPTGAGPIDSLPIISGAQRQILDRIPDTPEYGYTPGVTIRFYDESEEAGVYGPWYTNRGSLMYAMSHAPAPGV